MTDPNYQHMRQIAEGAVDLAIAGAPEVDVEAEGLIRVSIRRLDIGGDGSALDAVLNDLTADVEQLKEVFNAWARDDARIKEDMTEEVERLKERLGTLPAHVGDHDVQLDALHRGHAGLREIIDRLIDRVSAVAESAAAGDGMMRDDLIERIETTEGRVNDLELALAERQMEASETFVMSPEDSALTRAELLARGVPCTVCGARPGEPCRDDLMRDMPASHVGRLERARAEADTRGRA
jgi:DNA repair exonuclease SbcCD ATPase subunit